MKNILQLIISPPLVNGKNSITGPERRAARLASNWKKHGLNVIVCYPKRGRLYEDFEKAHIPIINFEIKSKYNFLSIFKLRKIIKNYKIELVHSQGPASLDLILAISGLFLNVKTLVTRPVMISQQLNYSKIRKRLYEIIDQYITLRLIDFWIVVSQDGYNILTKRYKLNDNKLKLIYNGVDTDKLYSNNVKKESSDKFIIGMIGQLFPPKGWYDFIDTIFYIKNNTNRNFNAFIIGEGEMMMELKKYVISKDLEDFIIFKGYVENIKPILESIDLILFTTHREGLSVAILEAMSMSVPQIITNVGGGREQIKNDVNGYIFEVGEIEKMGEKCIELMKDSTKLRVLSENSRKIAVDFFSQKTMFQNYLETYNKLLNS